LQKNVILRSGKLVSASKKHSRITLISDQQRSAIYGQDARMKIRMTRVLRFWVDVEFDRIKNQEFGRTAAQLIAQILGKFEEAGDAMRYLTTKSEIAWKATPGMLSRLADAEQEAIDDMED
jgi:hypothetical protein